MSDGQAEKKPPVFATWSGWYWLVALVMLAQLIIYLLISESFS